MAAFLPDLERLNSELSLEKLALKDISSWGTCS
jgi:hypothetical protein